MGKIAVSLSILAITMMLSLAITLSTMVYGWGLQPQNWWVIIGCWIASFCIVAGNTIAQEIIKGWK